MFGLLGMVLACSVSSEAERDAIRMHSDWATLRNEYQKAVSIYEEQQFNESTDFFRSLHRRYPHSRAVLEGYYCLSCTVNSMWMKDLFVSRNMCWLIQGIWSLDLSKLNIT